MLLRRSALLSHQSPGLDVPVLHVPVRFQICNSCSWFFLLLFFLYGWIPIGELCTFYFFFRSSDFPLANPPRNLRYSLFFGFTFVQICNCGGLKRVIFLSFPYSLPLWYVYEHILPPKSPTVNRFFQFFHFSFLLYHSVIP